METKTCREHDGCIVTYDAALEDCPMCLFIDDLKCENGYLKDEVSEVRAELAEERGY